MFLIVQLAVKVIKLKFKEQCLCSVLLTITGFTKGGLAARDCLLNVHDYATVILPRVPESATVQSMYVILWWGEGVGEIYICSVQYVYKCYN